MSIFLSADIVPCHWTGWEEGKQLARHGPCAQRCTVFQMKPSHIGWSLDTSVITKCVFLGLWLSMRNMQSLEGNRGRPCFPGGSDRKESTCNTGDPFSTRACYSFSHVRLWDPVDCSPPGSSAQGILQARKRVGCHALLKEIFPTQGQNPYLLLTFPALAFGFFTTSTTWEAHVNQGKLSQMHIWVFISTCKLL